MYETIDIVENINRQMQLYGLIIFFKLPFFFFRTNLFIILTIRILLFIARNKENCSLQYINIDKGRNKIYYVHKVFATVLYFCLTTFILLVSIICNITYYASVNLFGKVLKYFSLLYTDICKYILNL